ncbi:MAG TPA: glycosyltransferase family 4 protein [Polyangia bacterium]|jgi:glycosyltransferase involved in cell wall biosynthesis
MATPEPLLVVLHHYFGPYHLARARVLRQLLGDSVRFVQLATSGTLRAWQADSSGVPLETAVEGVLESIPPAVLAAGLERTLDRIRPTVIAIAGYGDAGMRGAATWARRHGASTILMSDSQYRDWPRRAWREALKRRWVSRHFDAAFVSGASAAFYAESLGIPAHMIWRGYDVVDNKYFEEQAAVARADADRQRGALGLPRQFFLFVGRFIPEKNLPRLIEAFSMVAGQPAMAGWDLVMVGSGPLEETVRRQAAPLGDRVRFCGFQQLDRLPAYYGLASALVLPSVSESWGLAVNEAMACGLPIILSRQCGCATDLAFPGVNAVIVDPSAPRTLARAFVDLASDPSRREAFGRASKRIVENFTLDTWSRGLIGCSLTLQKMSSEAHE